YGNKFVGALIFRTHAKKNGLTVGNDINPILTSINFSLLICILVYDLLTHSSLEAHTIREKLAEVGGRAANLNNGYKFASYVLAHYIVGLSSVWSVVSTTSLTVALWTRNEVLYVIHVTLCSVNVFRKTLFSECFRSFTDSP
ncbi:hypothetical protein L9F63_011947, partial [Diploptera punctata]